MKRAVLAVVFTVLLAMLMRPGAMALTCPDVVKPLMQCVQYLIGEALLPAPACCDGVKQLKSMVTIPEDKRFACDCAKQAASHYPNLNDDAVRDLPNKCNSPISFPISKSIDCST
ncbi:hypothetical protein Scep_027534 [Stephania cephalantha]|uniref:Bifunctional inhibitor/plant lipid transfer protein/seed storage helical domain-containing protein n=1 Tax=Stephania cephalantha TaxID=152367 RepID=A0AAP0HKW0_9MAGN